MKDWEEVSLNEVGRFASGRPIKPGGEGRFKAFGSNGVIGGSNEYRHARGIIVGRVGAYCGSVAISREPFWASDNTVVIVPVVDDDLDFLYYLLLGANLNQHAGGSAQPLVTQSTLKALQFRVPPQAVRSKIGHALRVFDELIENNRRQVELLEEIGRTTYREWFVHFRFPDHESIPVEETAFGPVPAGWRVLSIGDLIRADKGVSYSGAGLTASGIPMANLKCFASSGGFRRDGTKPYSGPFKPKHEVQPGDLIMANTDLTQAGTVIGGPALIPRKGFAAGGIISHHLFAIRCASLAQRSWLYETFRDDRFRQYARSVASGTTVLGLRPADLLAYRLAVPPSDLLDRFSERVGTLVQLAETINDLTECLADIRALVLPKLITGQVDVSSLNFDALLEGHFE